MISLGPGKIFKYIGAHRISEALGPLKSESLPPFDARTGCDQTSAFAGKGKKTAWETWKVFDEVTQSFESLSNLPTTDTIEELMPAL